MECEEIRELPKLGRVKIGDGPAGHTVALEANEIEAIFAVGGSGAFTGRDEKIDNVFIAVINESGDLALIEIIQSPADQRKTSTARSMTGGEKSSLPENHGFTV